MRKNSSVYSVDCIVLAAGLSTRMHQWKMVLPFQESTIIETCVSNALRVVQRVILVTGYRGEELRELFLHNPRVILVLNGNYPSGMFSSVQCGCKEVKSGHFFIIPGDMPMVGPKIYGKLLECKREDVVVPVFGTRGGHPVLLSEKIKQKILHTDSSSNLKAVLQQFPQKRVPIRSESITIDFDTEKDYFFYWR